MHRRFFFFFSYPHSKSIRPAYIKDDILLFGSLFPYIYIKLLFISECIYQTVYKDGDFGDGGLSRFWCSISSQRRQRAGWSDCAVIGGRFDCPPLLGICYLFDVCLVGFMLRVGLNRAIIVNSLNMRFG